MSAFTVFGSNDHRQEQQIDQSPESVIIAPTSLVNEALRSEIEMNMTGEHAIRLSQTLRARVSRGAGLADPENSVHKVTMCCSVQHQEYGTWTIRRVRDMA